MKTAFVSTLLFVAETTQKTVSLTHRQQAQRSHQLALPVKTKDRFRSNLVFYWFQCWCFGSWRRYVTFLWYYIVRLSVFATSLLSGLVHMTLGLLNVLRTPSIRYCFLYISESLAGYRLDLFMNPFQHKSSQCLIHLQLSVSPTMIFVGNGTEWRWTNTLRLDEIGQLHWIIPAKLSTLIYTKMDVPMLNNEANERSLPLIQNT